MNAAQYLLTKSSLLAGSAEAHLLSAFALGTGVVVNDGIEVEVEFMTVIAEIEDTAVIVVVDPEAIEVELNDNELIVEVEEW